MGGMAPLSLTPATTIAPVDGEATSDVALLALVRAQASETAFTTLVRRHQGLVLATCRRVLGSPADADDAVQATFLVLHRRSAQAPPDHLAGWWWRWTRRPSSTGAEQGLRR